MPKGSKCSCRPSAYGHGVPEPSTGLLAAYFSTLLLTLTNPATILSFVAVFARIGLGGSPDYLSATALVAGVFIGSALWWLLLSTGVSLFRQRTNAIFMRFVNRLSGTIIFAFGVLSLALSLSR